MNELNIDRVMDSVKCCMEEHSYAEAISLCKETLKDLESESKGPENERRKTQVLFCLSDICHVSGNWVDGLMYLSTVINKTSEMSEPDIRNEAIIRSGDILSKMGKWDKALEKYNESEKSVKRFNNPYLLGRALVGKGVVYWRQGKYQKAIDCVNEARRLGRSTKNIDLIGRSASLMASIHFDMRNYNEAIADNDAALESYRSLKNDIEVARILNNKGEVFKMMGEYDKAIGTFREGLEVLSNCANNRSLGYLYTNLAESQARKGDVAEARATAGMAEKQVMLSQDKYIKGQLFIVKAILEFADGNSAEALKNITSAEQMMKKLEMPYDIGIVQLEHARILRGMDSARAATEYRNAISSFRKADTPDMLRIAESELQSLGA